MTTMYFPTNPIPQPVFLVKESPLPENRIITPKSNGTYYQPDTSSYSRGVIATINSLKISASSMPSIHILLRTKWSIELAKAKELEELHPDPIQEMINLFASIPVDSNTWQEIIEEPYG